MSIGEIVPGDQMDISVIEPSVLAELNSSEIDVQISTAKKYPRSLRQFREDATELATLDERTAASMFFALPRAGKTIDGPSIRLAEVVGASYGNLRYASRIVSTEERFITAQGVCHDLQKNIACSVDVRRRITNRDGKRFNDDMIVVTGNAAASIALRNAIFKIVPLSLVTPIYQAARLASIGEAKTMQQQRAGALEFFQKLGVQVDEVLRILGRRGEEDITIDDIVSLRGLATAIKDGDTTVEQAFDTSELIRGGKQATRSTLNDPPPNPAPKPSEEPEATDEVFDEESIKEIAGSCETPEECERVMQQMLDRFPNNAEEIRHSFELRIGELLSE